MPTDSTVDQMHIQVFETRQQLGEAAATATAAAIGQGLAVKQEVNIVFAAAPSQNEFLAALIRRPLDWSRINAFHMDEYVGFTASRVESFRHYLRAHLLDQLAVHPVFHEIRGEAPVPAEECARYWKRSLVG